MQLLDETNLMPHDIEIEKSVLGSIIETNRLFDEVENIFKGKKVFYSEFHQRVYDSIKEILIGKYDYLEIADFITIDHVYKIIFANDTEYNLSRLASILSKEASKANIKHQSFMLMQLFQKRELKKFALNVSEKTSDNTIDVFDTLDYVASFIDDTQSFLHSIKSTTLKSDIDNLLDNLGQPSKKIKTYIDRLDSVYKGFAAGTLTIIAGRPAMGKTAVACQVIMNIALIGRKKVAFLNLEMTKEQIIKRLLSNYTGFTNSDILSFETDIFDDEKLKRFKEASKHFPTENITVIDASARIDELSIMKSVIKNLVKNGCECVVIDYLQLIESRANRKNENRVQEISEVSRTLKKLSVSLKIPIIALAQLSREVEKRDNKLPKMSDLRDSGSIEQDADNIIMLHRDYYYDKSDWNKEKELILIPVKNRHGYSDTKGFDVEIDLPTNSIK